MRALPVDHPDAARATRIVPHTSATANHVADEALARACAAVAPLLVTVLERVFGELCAADPGHIVRVVHTALKHLDPATALEAHPDDIARITAALTTPLAVAADASLAVGGALVRGAITDIDARARTQLLRAVQRCLAEHDA